MTEEIAKDTLIGALAASFTRHRERPAVAGGGGEATYGELWEGACRVAAALHEAGVGRGSRVGLWMEKSPQTVQTLLGTMLAGAAYVPLDPRSPAPRAATIASDCGIGELAVDPLRAAQLAEFRTALGDTPFPGILLHAGAEAEAIERGAAAAGAGAQALLRVPSASGGNGTSPMGGSESEPAGASEFPLPDVGPDDLAYILYTSGSTGRPKGVTHTHRSGLSFPLWARDAFGLSTHDRVSSHAPFHFDLSTFDLFASFLAGASVRLITSTEAMLPPWLCAQVDGWGITVWYSVPSALTEMMQRGDLEARRWPRMRVVLFAGEVFPTPHLRRLRAALPDVRLVNLFGPTETNVCTWYEVDALPDVDAAGIPIGRVCENLSSAVLDEHGREVAPGEEGDLWIGGDNVFAGYWNDPERTAGRLRTDPRTGLSMYNTGDRVRIADDGNLEFLGRRDHMIKVRGYRVELGDVEATLYAHPRIREAAAVALPDPETGNRIVAFVATDPGGSVDPGDIRHFLRSRLPLYMVPHTIERLESLPRSSTGKVDREGLRERTLRTS